MLPEAVPVRLVMTAVLECRFLRAAPARAVPGRTDESPVEANHHPRLVAAISLQQARARLQI